MGKEFSANAFHEMFADKNGSLAIVTEKTENKIESEPDFIASLFEQHSADCNAENFAKEKQKEEEVRKKKNKGRGL